MAQRLQTLPYNYGPTENILFAALMHTIHQCAEIQNVVMELTRNSNGTSEERELGVGRKIYKIVH